MRLALANLHRPGTPLRSTLLSLGSALTLLVTCTLVVVSLVRTIQTTIPAESPSMVLYDINVNQLDQVTKAIDSVPSIVRVETAPLVRGRMQSISGRSVSDLLEGSDEEQRDALTDDHKLSYREGNIDGITLVAGDWWAEPADKPRMSLEDREAGRLGVTVGDQITYNLNGQPVELTVSAIHKQKGVQTRFWFEGIVSDAVIDEHINRYVGAAWLQPGEAIQAQKNIAAVAPNVISVRTEKILATARQILGQATVGLVVVAAISLTASLLVLGSVIAAGRSQQIYTATVLNTLGVRVSEIRRSILLEYLVLALITALFAILLGSAIALPVLEIRMKLPSIDLFWVGVVTAVFVSLSSLSLGAYYLMRRLRLKPVLLLRNAT